MTIYNILQNYNWDEVKSSIYSKTPKDVDIALSTSKPSLEDFKALISPAAKPYLEQMAALSRNATLKRFGKTVQMYAPLYLSNVCYNGCIYCGFSFKNKIKRKTLTDEEILIEAKAIKALGYDHILLVSGEADNIVDLNYFINAIRIVKPYFSNISMEVQPLDQDEYLALHNEGVYAVLVYQETYNQGNYNYYHPKGKKSHYQYRVETPDRIGASHMHKAGLGVLLGLDDWRANSFYCAVHLDYLQRTYWQTKYSISFPRIRPASGVEFQYQHVTDSDLVQLICAYRLFNNDVELSISTRETPKFRDNIIKLGITSISAGSKTNPGGYAVEPQALEQFVVNDARSCDEVFKMIQKQGYEPIWKDWDRTYNSISK
ncbi:MAG: 2-iminoacetate synthase ThiH [Bacteroidota bacterium]|nr:2-iminoacetate synthase ThiH [Bacteroidota bacterium]